MAKTLMDLSPLTEFGTEDIYLAAFLRTCRGKTEVRYHKTPNNRTVFTFADVTQEDVLAFYNKLSFQVSPYDLFDSYRHFVYVSKNI